MPFVKPEIHGPRGFLAPFISQQSPEGVDAGLGEGED